MELSFPEKRDMKPRITVFGVGGAGGNAVNNMIEKQLEGVDFVVANTDAQALAQSRATNKIQLGEKVTEGLGAGAQPEIGGSAAEESIEAIVDKLSGVHMCFITAGMGGGTGTGAGPIVARAAREMGILSVGVVTKPFAFEGSRRMRIAETGIEELQQYVDTLIVIPNQNLFLLANEKTTFTEAFAMADDVLYQGVKGVTDLMVRPGLMNLDFADVRAVMNEMGKAMMGTGEAGGENRAVEAAEKAIANPLLDEVSLKGARGVLINITGGHDLTLMEFDEAANRIRNEVDPDANIIVGSTLDEKVEGALRVTVVATGIDADEVVRAAPTGQNEESNIGATAFVPDEVVDAASDAAGTVEEPMSDIIASDVTSDVASDVASDVGADMASDLGSDIGAQADPSEPDLFGERETAQTPQEEVQATPDVATVAAVPPAVAMLQRGEGSAGFNTKADRVQSQADSREESASPRSWLRSVISQGDGKAAEPQTPEPAAPELEAEEPATSIPSLLGRMTGKSEEELRPTPEPSVVANDQDDAERERIQIPAFLRRQAN